jgi:hypothetical protein
MVFILQRARGSTGTVPGSQPRLVVNAGPAKPKHEAPPIAAQSANRGPNLMVLWRRKDHGTGALSSENGGSQAMPLAL